MLWIELRIRYPIAAVREAPELRVAVTIMGSRTHMKTTTKTLSLEVISIRATASRPQPHTAEKDFQNLATPTLLPIWAIL